MIPAPGCLSPACQQPYRTGIIRAQKRVEVPTWRNPKTSQVFLTGTARETLEQVKARHLGLLMPAQIKDLRTRLDLTQKQISELLQIGGKSWTRWETGKERPS